MPKREIGPPRGIVRRAPSDEAEPHRHVRLPVAADLAHFVEHFWGVRWDRRGLPPFTAETLPHASVHLVLEREASTLHGVSRGRFSRVLEGEGEVFGIKFRPGGFRPFVTWPVTRITERVLPLAELGDAWADLEDRVLSVDGDEARVATVEAFLRSRRPVRDPLAETAAALVERICEGEPRRVEDLVRIARTSERDLQRLFREYVGVSPKWVIQRHRLHEALARIEDGGGTFDGAALAQELGYFDQAHFTRDFRAIVGIAPGAYGRRLRRR